MGKLPGFIMIKDLLSEVYQEGVDMPKYLTNKYTYNDKNWLIEELSKPEPNKEFSKNTYTLMTKMAFAKQLTVIMPILNNKC